MDLQTRKLVFIEEFIRLQNEEIISGLEKLLRAKKIEQFEKNISPMSLEQYCLEIDQAMQDSNDEKITSANEIRQKIKKWA
jgi:replication fork clamp-binding protein CrfC